VAASPRLLSSITLHQFLRCKAAPFWLRLRCSEWGRLLTGWQPARRACNWRFHPATDRATHSTVQSSPPKTL
jgi:hypothetical protein